MDSRFNTPCNYRSKDSVKVLFLMPRRHTANQTRVEALRVQQFSFWMVSWSISLLALVSVFILTK